MVFILSIFTGDFLVSIEIAFVIGASERFREGSEQSARGHSTTDPLYVPKHGSKYLMKLTEITFLSIEHNIMRGKIDHFPLLYSYHIPAKIGKKIRQTNPHKHIN